MNSKWGKMIEFKNIFLKYDEKVIFNDFSTRIKRNEKVLLNAPSGAGKSTLLKMIVGFARPNQGKVFVNSKQVDSLNIDEIRSDIAYLPQSITFPEMQVNEFIQTVLDYKSNKGIKYQRDEILKLFHDLQLSDKILTSNTETLSGGERQRVGIVLMQLLKRKIFLLDELTSALNQELKELVKEYFLSLDKTVIVVSHDKCWNDSRIKELEW